MTDVKSTSWVVTADLKTLTGIAGFEEMWGYDLDPGNCDLKSGLKLVFNPDNGIVVSAVNTKNLTVCAQLFVGYDGKECQLQTVALTSSGISAHRHWSETFALSEARDELGKAFADLKAPFEGFKQDQEGLVDSLIEALIETLEAETKETSSEGAEETES